MAGQTRTGSDTAANDAATAARGGGTSDQPGDTAATGTAGQQSVPGKSFPLPMPGLLANVDPKRVLWWGGLAALAAVEVIDWPVAAVVGAGSYVAERWARQAAQRDMRQQS
jgi:hypothetical protein